MSNRIDDPTDRPKLRLVEDDEDTDITVGASEADAESGATDDPDIESVDTETADDENGIGYAEGEDTEDYDTVSGLETDEEDEDNDDEPGDDDESVEDDETWDDDGSVEDDESEEDDEPGDDDGYGDADGSGDGTENINDAGDDPELATFQKKMKKHRSRRIQKILDIILCSVLVADLVLGVVFVLGFTGVIRFDNNKNITKDDVISAMNSDGTDTAPKTEKTNKKKKKDEEEITFTISATGDCTFGNAQVHTYDGSFMEYYDNYGADYFLKNCKDVFKADNMTLINLECALTRSNSAESKDFNLRGYPEYTDIMTGSSIEAVSLGNNHTYDYGETGFSDTVNALKDAGIGYAYRNTVATFKTSSGITIGVVSAGLQSQTIEAEQYIYDGIEKLKEDKVDLIIACVHWGVEKDYYANDYQIEVGHMIIDAGADLLIGNHPHVLQGVEIYNKKIICYSLGNFCFGGNKNPTDKDSAIFQQTFHFDKNKKLKDKVDAQFIPISISGADDHNDYCPVILKKKSDRYAKIISDLNDYCAPISDTMVGKGGKIKLSTEPG